MPNVAFDLEVLARVSATAPVPGNPMFAQLGAVGPDVFVYLPISGALSDALHAAFQQGIQGHAVGDTLSFDLSAVRNNTTLATELFEKPMMAAYALLFREVVVDFWPILQRDRDTLAALQAAAAAQDADAVASLKDALQQVSEDGTQLKQLGLLLKGFGSLLPQLIAIPPSIQSTNPAAKPWLPLANRLFEFLRWHHTDDFAAALVSSANGGDQQAYAFGHLCHVAASVTGRPFVNNINGGPYRTHWWRNLLVSNFVDSWTFGRYETPATMSGDTPSVPYASWKNICTANLQNRFNVAGIPLTSTAIPDLLKAVATGQLGGLPAQFPQPLANYIQAAVDLAYPAALRPAGFSAGAVGQSFCGLVAVSWFMTGGFGPTSWSANDLGDAPAACPTAPSWVTGGGSPPSPQSGPGVGDILEGIVYAICALIDFIFGSWSDGVALLKNAIGHFGSQTDWDQFQCNTWWLRKTLLDAGLAVVDALVKLGLAYPAADQLGTVDANGVTQPALDLSALPLTKSNVGASARLYPHRMDASVANAPDLDFSKFPSAEAETPATLNLPLDAVYADVVVDGSGLANGGLLAGGTFPSAGLFFGDAVANALALIAANGQGLANFNLDADRGYGFETWNPKVNTFPGSGDVTDPRPES